MAWTKYQTLVVVLLILTGTINTICSKWANLSKAVGADGKELRPFQHPFLQASFMFLGEMLCMVVYKLLYFYYWRKKDGSEDEMKLVKGSRTFNQLILLPPALFDMIATTIMYIGLILTYAASFQMLAGAVIVFVGLFSMCFLKRKIGIQSWAGIFLVILGLALVGLSDFLSPGADIATQDHSTRDILIGDALIVAAQFVMAMQLVWEEKYLIEFDIPALQAVGWEGIFGFSGIALLLIPFYFIPVPESFSGNPRKVVADAVDGFVQMYNSHNIMTASLVNIISTSFFNFAAISVTKELSATTRKVLDSIRTLFIWMFTLGMGWQEFYWLQIIGFILLVTGTLVYNKAFANIRWFGYKRKDEGILDDQEKLPTAADEETKDNSPTDEEIGASSADKPEKEQS